MPGADVVMPWAWPRGHHPAGAEDHSLPWPSRGSAPNTCSPRGVCQPSGSASSDFSVQQPGFSLASGPSCRHPQGSGGKGVVRWDAAAPRCPSSACSLHPALVVERHRVRCSHSCACCSIRGARVAPRRGSTSHALWLLAATRPRHPQTCVAGLPSER